MAEVKDGDGQLESSGSPKDDNLSRNEDMANGDTSQQEQPKELEELSIDGPGNLNIADQSYETKVEDSHSSRSAEIKINVDGIDTTETQTQSTVKVDELEVEENIATSVMGNKADTIFGTNKSSSSITKNHVKINTSNTQKSIDSLNKINDSQSAQPKIRTNSSNFCADSAKTSSSEDHEKVQGTYKVFPKSVPSSVHVNPNLITVKFVCDNDAFASAFDKKTTVEGIREFLCDILELEEDFINLECSGTTLKDSQTLADLGGQPYGKVVFKVFSKNGERNNTLLKERIRENIPTIDVITVHLGEDELNKDVVVGIENESVHKQWLGGFRNKVTGIVYHNANTQTTKPKKLYECDKTSGEKIPLHFNRDTQTNLPCKNKTFNTVVDKATQMLRTDLYVTSKNDKIMTARSQTDNMQAKMDDEHFIKHVIAIQRSVRKWIRCNQFTELINLQISWSRKFREERQRIARDQEDKDRIVLTGVAYPVTRDDFYALFLIVEKWWKKEWKKICESKRSESKKAASVVLIEKETELLQVIEKHKAASKGESLKKEQMRGLDQISRPILFRSSKGHLTTIDNLETQKAREFKEIYSALACKDVSPKVRLEILITMKNLFESHYMEYEYATDLVSLIKREIELIGIGMKSKDLKGLRSRIEQLFLNFLQQPEFNPSAKKYKKPNLPKTLHQSYQCPRCLRVLPASKYFVHVRMKSFTKCKSCTWMENIAHQRVDMTPYLKLLHQVQNSEMQKCCHSAVCFILQPIGMGYLTNVIWHGHSAISELSDVSKLLHVRWLPDVEWAPWNTILLTEQEAKLHESIPDIFTFYDEQFIENVRQKHILARKRFIPLLIMDHDVRSSGQWANITDSGTFLHPSHDREISREAATELSNSYSW